MDWKLHDILNTIADINVKSPSVLASDIRAKLGMTSNGTGVCEEVWGRLSIRAVPGESTHLPDSVSDTEWIKLLRKKLLIICSEQEMKQAVANSVEETILEK